MKKVMLNEQPLAGFNVYANAPIGSIMLWLSDNAPIGWVHCTHVKLPIASYPTLYNILKDIPQCQSEEEGYFYTPDFRETTIVGAGENATAEITAHDIYTIGEFKDDQLQGHWHKVHWTNGNESHYYANENIGNYGGGDKVEPPERDMATDIVTDRTNGTPRTGTTTHGKQTGAHYIIKATEYQSLPQNAIDDTKYTTGNTLSAEKINADYSKNVYNYDEEVIVGYVIKNGVKKPLYRRSFEVMKNGVLCNGWTRNGTTFSYTDLSFIDELITNKALTDAGILTSWSPGTDGINYSTGIARNGTNGFSIINGARGTFNGNNCNLILEYTKTTS